MHNMSKSELKTTMETNKDVLVVNVLPEDSFKQKHIPSSINIPFVANEANFVAEVENRAGSKEALVVVYCASAKCDTSSKAMRALENAGFSNVHTYKDGLAGWFGGQTEDAAA